MQMILRDAQFWVVMSALACIACVGTDPPLASAQITPWTIDEVMMGDARAFNQKWGSCDLRASVPSFSWCPDDDVTETLGQAWRDTSVFQLRDSVNTEQYSLRHAFTPPHRPVDLVESPVIQWYPPIDLFAPLTSDDSRAAPLFDLRLRQGPGDLAPRYIKPHFFDWGVFKSHGNLILLFTSAAYLACVAFSIILLRQAARRIGANIAVVIGVFAVGPMLLMGWWSIGLQMTSAHYQETIHIPAVITFAVCFSVVVIVWLLSRVRHPTRHDLSAESS